MIKHNMSKHPAYQAYYMMKSRCLNKNRRDYANYGGRGIKICNKWLLGFEFFWEDMGTTWRKGLSLDRINNNGNYTPENCRWATRKQQNQNQRKNIKVIVGGTEMCVSEAARLANIAPDTVYRRLKLGWSIEVAFAPIQTNISELARKAGLSPYRVHSRLKRGWSLERALETTNK